MNKDFIEKIDLPVTITKVKIGGKFLTKSLIEQLPMDLFVYHYDENIKQKKNMESLVITI